MTADRRENISSGSEWETKFGYSRAVRVGDHIHVSGTTAVDERGEVLHKSDAYRQTVAILKRIESALSDAGAELRHVVRTRMYVTDIAHASQVGRAHGEFFGEIRPASTLVQIVALVSPEMLVEIEVDAYIRD